MPATVTLSQLRTRVRERADMENSSFVSDTELNGYINNSARELYDLLVDAVQDYKISSHPFTISSGNTEAVPADFYKVRGIDDNSTTPARTVKKFNFAERNDYAYPALSSGLSLDYSDVTYRLLGDNLTFYPPERAAKTYTLWYVPALALLTLDADTLDGVNGWEEYVIVDAAIKCLIKEESSTTALSEIKKDLIKRINNMKPDRDQSQPEKIARVRNRSYNRLVTSSDYVP